MSRSMSWHEQLKAEHERRASDDLWRTRSVLDSPQGCQVTVEGKSYLNFCSNDYLGLNQHPELKSAATEAIDQWGNGTGASHLVCGHLELHHKLETELARFVGSESAILFSTGYMANLAIPTALLGRSDLLLQDRLNHASLIDAGRMGSAKMQRYPHIDLAELESKLAKSDAPRKLVMTDGVFSMDGDIAPIAEMNSICQQHGALLVVDDAHGLGVLGNRGAGTLESAGLRPSGNILMMGTLGKSLGSFGAFIAGDDVFIQTLIQTARTYIYTTALPPSVVATTHAALRVIQFEPQHRARLHETIAHFRESIADSTLSRPLSTTPIQPFHCGSSRAALKASHLLRSKGIWVSAIRPPTVPNASARLRITLTSQHLREDVDRLVEVLKSESMVRIIEEGAK